MARGTPHDESPSGSAEVASLAAVLGDVKAKKAARLAAARSLCELGPQAAAASSAVAAAALDKDAAVRRAALDVLLGLGAEPEAWGESAAALLDRGDDAVVPLLATWGRDALALIAPRLSPTTTKAKPRQVAAQALVEIAGELDGPEVADEVEALLVDGKEALQRLGLEAVARLRRPPARLAEPVADLSSQPGARRALLRFDKEWVKRELRSLIKSQSREERLCGLEIVQQYGASASEFAEQIVSLLPSDQEVATVLASVHALDKILPDDELAQAVAPLLDHWSEDVHALACDVLSRSDAPARASIWEGHPFSDALLRQLQRMRFEPHGAMTPPARRPYGQDRPLLTRADRDATLETPVELSPALWGLLEGLKWPHDGVLYTVWSSYESSQTFHFADEAKLHEIEIRGRRHLMHVIGDGSIGYYAAVDLLDTSDDPAVYYVERWHPEGWQVSRSLSRYLRQLGLR